MKIFAVALLLSACAAPTVEQDLYARSAVDARVREFKLGNGIQEAHCTTSHSRFAECSGVTEGGRACRFICRIDDCEWQGR